MTDRNVEAGLEAQIAIGENADQLSVLRDRHAGNFVFAHHLQRVGNLVIRAHRHRIHDHAALGSLHLVHFFGLLLDGQIAVNDPEPALLGQRNRHVGFGDRIHGGADNGNIEADVAGELGLSVGARRDYIGAGRQQ